MLARFKQPDTSTGVTRCSESHICCRFSGVAVMVKAITGAQVNALNPPILAKAVLNSCPGGSAVLMLTCFYGEAVLCVQGELSSSDDIAGAKGYRDSSTGPAML